jgi:hypothetical protein
MDLAPLLCVTRTTEKPLLFLVCRLLLTIPVISTVPVIPAVFTISCVDLLIVLLLLYRPLATRFK